MSIFRITASRRCMYVVGHCNDGCSCCIGSSATQLWSTFVQQGQLASVSYVLQIQDETFPKVGRVIVRAREFFVSS